MIINVFIIDDEPSSIETLKLLLTEYFTDIEIVGTCNTIAQAPAMLQQLQPDLVFLDVEMPGGSGFDVLRNKYFHDFEVVITTAYSNYAIKAFQFNALHYILKPIDREELSIALTKTRHRMEEKKKPNHQPSASTIGKLALPTTDGISFINISDIMRCTARENYTEVYLLNKDRILVSRTLREFEEALNEHHFVRVHNSFLVNLLYIDKYSKSGYITMNDGSIVEVSKRRKNIFLEKFALLGGH